MKTDNRPKRVSQAAVVVALTTDLWHWEWSSFEIGDLLDATAGWRSLDPIIETIPEIEEPADVAALVSIARRRKAST